MEHNVKISAVVTKADGKLFYKGSHEWDGLSDEDIAEFQQRLTSAAAHFQNLHNTHKKDDKQNYTAVLEGSIDNVALPIISENGVSYHTVMEAEKHAAKMLSDLIYKAEKVHAPKHAKKGKP